MPLSTKEPEKPTIPKTAREVSGEQQPKDNATPASTTPDDIKQLEDSFRADDAIYPDNHPSKQEGSLYKPTKKKGKLKTHLKKKVIIGGGGVIASIIIGFLVLFSPLVKLHSFLETIDQRVFTFVGSTVETRMTYLFERYMINHITHMQGCTNATSPSCRRIYTQAGPIGNLFRGWSDARVEQRFFRANNIEITRNTRTGAVSLRMPDGTPISVGRTASGAQRLEMGGREAGRTMRQFIRETTKPHQFLQRRSMRAYLARKHGIRLWCFMACRQLDSLDRTRFDAKTRLRYAINQRLVYPFSAKYGLYLDCLANPANTSICSPDGLRSQRLDRSNIPTNERNAIIREAGRENARLTRFIIQNTLPDVLQQRALAAIPVVGQVYLAIVIVDMFDRLDGFVEDGGLTKFSANLLSKQYVEHYQAMRSSNDEGRAGELDLDEIGAIMELFDGEHPAETSLVYQAYLPQNMNQNSVAGLFSPQRASASSPYLCANGEPIPEGELVCNERKLDRTYRAEELRDSEGGRFIADIMLGPYQPLKPVIRPILDGIDFLVAGAIRIVTRPLAPPARATWNVIKDTTFVQVLLETTGQMFTWVATKVFPLPITDESYGRDFYDGLVAGGEVSAYEFAAGGYTEEGEPYGLGARMLSEEEQRQVAYDMSQQIAFEYEQMSFIARLTDTDNPYSVVNQFALNAPKSVGDIHNRLTGSLTTIISLPLTSFSKLAAINTAPAYAYTDWVDINPFGVPRHGYSLNDPNLRIDPDTLTEERCEEITEQWLDNKVDNEITGLAEYTMTNPCLLDEVIGEIGNGMFEE